MHVGERLSSNGLLARLRALAVAWQIRLICCGLAFLCIVGTALPDELGLPTFSAQHLSTPTTLICAWFGAILASGAGFEPSWNLYATAGMRPQIFNLVRVLLVGAMSGVLTVTIAGNASMACVGLAALLGVALLGGALVGHSLSWVAPTIYVIVIIGAGALDPAGGPRLWAAPGDVTPGAPQWVLAFTLLVIGVAGWWRSRARQEDLHRRD